jgi:hypothetical protein
MRRTVYLMAASLFTAFTAAGCSSAKTSSQSTTPKTTTSSTVPASPVESSTTSRPPPSTQPVSTASSSNSAPGKVALAPGGAYAIAGSGCASGALVQVTVESSTHATASLASQPSDSTGAFSITVKVPQLNSPTADLSASCVSTNAKGYVQIDVPISFTA